MPSAAASRYSWSPQATPRMPCAVRCAPSSPGSASATPAANGPPRPSSTCCATGPGPVGCRISTSVSPTAMTVRQAPSAATSSRRTTVASSRLSQRCSTASASRTASSTRSILSSMALLPRELSEIRYGPGSRRSPPGCRSRWTPARRRPSATATRPSAVVTGAWPPLRMASASAACSKYVAPKCPPSRSSSGSTATRSRDTASGLRVPMKISPCGMVTSMRARSPVATISCSVRAPSANMHRSREARAPFTKSTITIALSRMSGARPS
jgi:hypothetical protein